MLSKDETADPLCHAGVVNSSAVNVKALAWMRDSGTHCSLRLVLGHSDNHREGRNLAKARNEIIKRKNRAMNAAGCGLCSLMSNYMCLKFVRNTKIMCVQLIKLRSSKVLVGTYLTRIRKGHRAILIGAFRHFPLSLQNKTGIVELFRKLVAHGDAREGK